MQCGDLHAANHGRGPRARCPSQRAPHALNVVFLNTVGVRHRAGCGAASRASVSDAGRVAKASAHTLGLRWAQVAMPGQRRLLAGRAHRSSHERRGGGPAGKMGEKAPTLQVRVPTPEFSAHCGRLKRPPTSSPRHRPRTPRGVRAWQHRRRLAGGPRTAHRPQPLGSSLSASPIPWPSMSSVGGGGAPPPHCDGPFLRAGPHPGIPPASTASALAAAFLRSTGSPCYPRRSGRDSERGADGRTPWSETPGEAKLALCPPLCLAHEAVAAPEATTSHWRARDATVGSSLRHVARGGHHPGSG